MGIKETWVSGQPAGVRGQLLAEVRGFVNAAARVPGVRSIGLLGSIVTDRPDPKDIDVLVVIADDADLAPLAACARRLQGRAQSFNRGADVFLADELGHYLGRTCLLEGVRTRSARVMQCAALRPEAPSA